MLRVGLIYRAALQALMLLEAIAKQVGVKIDAEMESRYKEVRNELEQEYVEARGRGAY